MPADDFANLVGDIKTNGLREHGWTYEGMVIDGWHRYKACEQAGVRFRYEEYKGKDPAGFVESLNDHRRHMTASQRAMAKVSVNAWRGRGKSAPGADSGKTVEEMAKEASVSPRTIAQAKDAFEAGLQEPVRDGAISVKAAAEIAKGRDPDKKKPDLKDRRIAELTQTNEALKDEMEQVREGAAEAVAQAELAAALMDTEPAKLLLAKDAEIKRLTRDRDDYMNKCAQLVKQVKSLERRLARYEQAAA